MITSYSIFAHYYPKVLIYKSVSFANMLNQFRLIILNMELLFFAVAFACGFSIYQLKLPPLIGFLMAGFILNLMGHQTTDREINLAADRISFIYKDLLG